MNEPFRRIRNIIACILMAASTIGTSTLTADDFVPDRCEVIPMPDQQVSFQVDGVEKFRWHFSHEYPRPFIYPFNGPSGTSLTRMGHPGAAHHDHHRSVWFAHAKVNGVDFWSDHSKATIRQKHWYAYRDGADESIMATLLGWYDESGTELMEQDAVVALRPLASDGEYAAEFQITLRPAAGTESVVLEKTNFGPLAVRVSKTLSTYFGGGETRNSEGDVDEKNIFGKPARWMDYSGPVTTRKGQDRIVVQEGITYFDHPDNLRYPSRWHVREDGWMAASFGMDAPLTVTSETPLVLRYLLYAHTGRHDPEKAADVQHNFSKRPGFRIGAPPKGVRHQQFIVERRPPAEPMKKQ